MRTITLILVLGALFVAALSSSATTTRARGDFEITPAIQKKLDAWKKTAQAWCAEDVIVGAVQAQNRKGPIEGMTSDAWKKLRRRDPVIVELSGNAAAKLLVAKAEESDGAVSEAFLNAAKGEKVAFIDKTSSYIHEGSAKFDVPFATKKPWQGEPSFDESSQTYQIQVSVPVLVDVEGTDPVETKAIGVLVIGVDLESLEKKPRGK